MAEALRSKRLFSTVAPYDSHDRSELLMTGRIEKLDEIDYGVDVRAEAKLSADLINLLTLSIVWTGDASQTSRVERRDVNPVVREMSHALQESMDQPDPSEKERRALRRYAKCVIMFYAKCVRGPPVF
jgi:hypothetical protein